MSSNINGTIPYFQHDENKTVNYLTVLLYKLPWTAIDFI